MKRLVLLLLLSGCLRYGWGMEFLGPTPPQCTQPLPSDGRSYECFLDQRGFPEWRCVGPSPGSLLCDGGVSASGR